MYQKQSKMLMYMLSVFTHIPAAATQEHIVFLTFIFCVNTVLQTHVKHTYLLQSSGVSQCEGCGVGVVFGATFLFS